MPLAMEVAFTRQPAGMPMENPRTKGIIRFQPSKKVCRHPSSGSRCDCRCPQGTLRPGPRGTAQTTRARHHAPHPHPPPRP